MARRAEHGEGKLFVEVACQRNRRTDRSDLDYRRKRHKGGNKLASSESLAL